jgi:glycosyltransferase involved in cell wall biosynthesis
LIGLLSDDPDVSALCLGSGSDRFVLSLIEDVPSLAGRVHATGRISASDTAVALAACDLLLQPYIDGVTTRRTSVMAGLINARAVLTTTGHLTEPIWIESRAVALTPASDLAAFVKAAHTLLADQAERTVLGARAEKTYAERFALTHTIARLREAVAGAAA